MPVDASDRYLAASIAANSRWAHEADRSAATRPARMAFETRFLDEVDPARLLKPEERQRRAENAKRAYFHKLALKSAKSRRKSRQLTDEVKSETEALEPGVGDSV